MAPFTQDQHHAFHKTLHNYNIVPESLNSLYSKRATKITDLAKQRELKINQYKQEREFRSKINVRRYALSYGYLTLIPMLIGNKETARAKTGTIRIYGL